MVTKQNSEFVLVHDNLVNCYSISITFVSIEFQSSLFTFDVLTSVVIACLLNTLNIKQILTTR